MNRGTIKEEKVLTGKFAQIFSETNLQNTIGEDLR
jgi:hypothetical protein